MNITYLGHATVVIELDGVRILTDPILRSRVAHLRRHGTVLAEAAPETSMRCCCPTPTAITSIRRRSAGSPESRG